MVSAETINQVLNGFLIHLFLQLAHHFFNSLVASPVFLVFVLILDDYPAYFLDDIGVLLDFLFFFS